MLNFLESKSDINAWIFKVVYKSYNEFHIKGTVQIFYCEVFMKYFHISLDVENFLNYLKENFFEK